MAASLAIIKIFKSFTLLVQYQIKGISLTLIYKTLNRLKFLE